jgi:hypothetical protein
VATEIDKYVLDTNAAIAELRKLNDAVDRSASGMTTSFIKAEAAIGLFKQGFWATVELLKESVAAYAEAERVERQLAEVAGRNTEAFKRQAAAFQGTLGVSDEMVMQLQTMALQFGAAPRQVEALTQAVLDYSARTGKDAPQAMRTFLQAAAQGRDGIEKLGLRYQSTGELTKDLTLLTKELSAEYSGASAAAAETLEGKWNKLNESIGTLKENLGALFATVEEKTGALDYLSKYFGALNHLITGGGEKELAKSDALISKLKGIGDEIVSTTQALKQAQAVVDAGGFVTNAEKFRVTKLQQQIEDLKKQRAAVMQDLGMAPLEGDGKPQKTGDALKEEERRRKEALKARQEMERNFLRNIHRQNADENRKALEEQNRIDKEAEEERLEGEKRFMKNRHQNAHAMVLEAFEQQDKLDKEAEDKEEEHQKRLLEIQQERLEAAKDLAASFAGFGLALLKEQILANDEFNRELRQKSIERRAMEAAEDEIKQRYAEADLERMGEEERAATLAAIAKEREAGVAQELAAEEAAANQKRLAEFLANIGEQAAMKALFEGAAAVASAAAYDYKGAAEHAISAGLFAGVAVAAGAGAAAITQSRGRTSDEKAQLEDSDRRSQREARQRSQQAEAADVAPTVIFNQYGFTGVTETQRAVEMEKRLRDARRLKTGAR